MPLEELYWRCRDAFLANSEITLRAQLTEFKDHKLVKFSKVRFLIVNSDPNFY